ncbi:hypothetical protein F4560_002770 [Saccharothrix ecbatanensis]|uniref:A-factor biosynthesis hotdog domain-containing protein n=1 Tax=Saccharothrix ecbatanensis TaxID=1105145 RepID=A0A7W9HIL4_9PSEU|nr:ScbA/BarX family gamma-butyrolactone biosynthesis protein [Saccharothrix ecbatanensis]MBB5803002.1 hypothetical protein [Saccharothrix ecbatanensis]
MNHQPPAAAPRAEFREMAGDGLAFDRTVHKELVHRRSVHEVLLTDSARTSPDDFAVAAQLSRGHRLFGDRATAFHDPLMVLEAARQATVLVAHRYCDVAADRAFIANTMACEVTDLDALRDHGDPADAVIVMRTADRRMRSGELTGMTFAIDVTVDGARAMSMAGALMFMPRADYRDLRALRRAGKPTGGASTPASPLSASAVGRRDQRNVVIGPSGPDGTDADEARFAVVVDQRHPSLFDHELDHLPAIHLIEVFRQGAIAAAGLRGASPHELVLTRCDTTFTDFAELDAPVTCVVSLPPRDGGPWVARVGLEQSGGRIAEATVDLTPV